MNIKFWIHKDGWIYTGDKIEDARIATEVEILQHQRSVSSNDEATNNEAKEVTTQ